MENTLIATIDKVGTTRTEDNITLIEESESSIYIEDETSNTQESIESASLESGKNCETVHLKKFDMKEVARLDENLKQDVEEGIVILQNVQLFENKNTNTVYIEFRTGHSVELTGKVDAAYTY